MVKHIQTICRLLQVINFGFAGMEFPEDKKKQLFNHIKMSVFFIKSKQAYIILATLLKWNICWKLKKLRMINFTNKEISVISQVKHFENLT